MKKQFAIASAFIALSLGVTGTAASAQQFAATDQAAVDAATLSVSSRTVVEVISPVSGKPVQAVRTILKPAGAEHAAGTSSSAVAAAASCALTIDDLKPEISITGGTVFGYAYYNVSTGCTSGFRFTHYLAQNTGSWRTVTSRTFVAQPSPNTQVDSIYSPCFGTTGTSWRAYTSKTSGAYDTLPCRA